MRCRETDEVVFLSLAHLPTSQPICHRNGGQKSEVGLGPMSKRFQNGRLQGPTEERSASKIFRFGYGKAVNDPASAGVPDRVGSAVKVGSLGQRRY